MVTRLTGINPLDELISPTKRDWSVEIYGDPNVVLQVAHHTMVYRSVYEDVYVVLNIEFGGIDTLYLTKLCRIYSCNLDKIYISRAFRLHDTISILQNLEEVNGVTIAILFPYNYLPQDPSKYVEATKITNIINKLSQKNQVMIFNTVTRFGYRMPEGGSLHHHLVKIIVKTKRKNRWIVAELLKHPAKPSGVKVFSEKILNNPIPRDNQKSILNWITKNSLQKNTSKANT